MKSLWHAVRRHQGRVKEGGVSVVHDDPAPVDSARGVAPRGERVRSLVELDVVSRFEGVAGICEHCDIDGVLGHTPGRGSIAARAGPADLAHERPHAVVLDRGRRRRSARCREQRAGDHDDRRKHPRSSEPGDHDSPSLHVVETDHPPRSLRHTHRRPTIGVPANSPPLVGSTIACQHRERGDGEVDDLREPRQAVPHQMGDERCHDGGVVGV